MGKILYHVWKVDSHEREIPKNAQLRVNQNELTYKGIHKAVKCREISVSHNGTWG